VVSGLGELIPTGDGWALFCGAQFWVTSKNNKIKRLILEPKIFIFSLLGFSNPFEDIIRKTSL
jgi:hypothetical protein